MKFQILVFIFAIIVSTLAAEQREAAGEKRDKRQLLSYYGYAGAYPYASPYAAYPYAYAPATYTAYPAYAAAPFYSPYSPYVSPFAYYR